MIILDEWQETAILDISKKLFGNSDRVRGKVIIPTGGGKTILQSKIGDDYISKQTGHIHGVNGTFAPRIALALQHHKNKLVLRKNGFIQNEVLPLVVHSGGTGDDGTEDYDFQINDLPADVMCTTSPAEIRNQYERAKIMGIPLDINGTYASMERVFEAFKDDPAALGLLQGDECQYFVSNQYAHLLANLADWIFWTATQIFTNSNMGLGMNNVQSFGETMFRIAAKELIDIGRILNPRLIILQSLTTGDDLTDAENIVIETFKHQKDLNVSNIGVKLVFNTPGTQYIEYFENSKKIRHNCPNVDIFSISSRFGALINGKSVDRADWLKAITQSKDALIFHYDIISEGIDIDGLTGTVMMRSSALSKTLQQIGRVIRPHQIDRDNIANGSILPNSTDMIKPFGNVIIPVISGSEKFGDDNEEAVTKIVTALREYGFNPKENVIIHDPSGNEDDDDDPTGINNLNKKLKSANLAELFDVVDWHVEDVKLVTAIKDEIDMVSGW